jgi:hypothetical protein
MRSTHERSDRDALDCNVHSRRLLGGQIVGQLGSEIAKERVDVGAAIRPVLGTVLGGCDISQLWQPGPRQSGVLGCFPSSMWL